jgi:thiol-disulfide isomerase/thioredoxin
LLAGIGGLAAGAGYLSHLLRMGRLDPVVPDSGQNILNARLTGMDGSLQNLSTYKGHVLIVNFWATWCAPCREEIPLFVRLQQEFAVKSVQFIGIAIDQVDKVRIFADEFRINYPLLIGSMDALEISRKAGNKAGVLPYTVVLDRTGRISATLVGGISEARMREVLRPLL